MQVIIDTETLLSLSILYHKHKNEKYNEEDDKKKRKLLRNKC